MEMTYAPSAVEPSAAADRKVSITSLTVGGTGIAGGMSGRRPCSSAVIHSRRFASGHEA